MYVYGIQMEILSKLVLIQMELLSEFKDWKWKKVNARLCYKTAISIKVCHFSLDTC